ncbi:hypothetical protein L1987_58020 [Smallanthus sonchifolius]|uniref:Uncharacterized protein n=1 Tax=Smallanthus sonchifolius TaxID=185202 RepID=A0ACB9DED0_9ASTR|nr:hypothetical protein L1987_58020 [Smallanthus sonchifolius]
MASISNTFSFHFLLLILFSLSLQPHARENKFFTKVVHYLSNSPITSLSSVPAPAPVLVPELVPMTEPFLAPAPAPAEKEYGYGLYGQGSSEFSTEEYRTSSLEGSNDETLGDEEKETPISDEFTSEKEASFEKLLSSEGYSTTNNGYSNNGNGYSSTMNVNNGYNHNQNGYNNNGNGYNAYNQNGYNNGDGYNQNGYNGDGYNQNGYNNENGYNQNMYSNNYNNKVHGYSSLMTENNGYETDRRSQNNYNNYMSFTNDNHGYNGNGYTSSNEEYNGYNNGYMVEKQGLSDTRFLENGKYSYDANNNGNNHETSYGEDVRDNGEGYYNNEKSKYEFDTMEEYERQEGYPQSDQRGYVP